MTLALSCKILVIAAGLEMFAAVCFFMWTLDNH